MRVVVTGGPTDRISRGVRAVRRAIDRTGDSAAWTTGSLQNLPDSTLLGLAATSVGVGAGFYLAGKSRLVVAAGVVPAVLAGIAVILRPLPPPEHGIEIV